MHKDSELYDFLLSNVQRLTDEWFEIAHKNSTDGVYASNNPDVVNTIKRQNNDFHKRFFEVFKQDEQSFLNSLEDWILEIAQDEEHLRTPIHLILGEFNRTQEQYSRLIEEFVSETNEEYTIQEVVKWFRVLDRMFSKITVWFVAEHTKYEQEQIESQKKVISELSSPVITLNEEVALLPLVGDIDSSRSKIIMEKTLQQCASQGVNHLLMDLSGVVTIDEVVASELMDLIDALKLVGVTTTLSGLRPEIAQATVKLGLSFGHVSIKPTLAESIRFRHLSLR
ncbi:STAS domain-containing protein [Alteribacter aurantiacus]|uniref:STAS domain-containing protein n=1 Tax=Alteribacter aurantiacus TaxID=254410 RepID=UPI000420FA7B|nr:STAS domain-containing protein [Alteribacter aurantiacus]